LKPSALPPCVQCGAEWLPSHECQPITEVVFRVWPKSEGGDVLALFPYDHFDAAATLCSSYQHVGGHGGADYSGCVRRTRPAKPEEYARLKRELESEPYNYRLKVVQRRGRR
jgi:hypothetical protein